MGVDVHKERLDAVLDELALRESGAGDTEADELLIWWLSEADYEHLTKSVLEGLPEYISDEVQSLGGRNGRGRLWVPTKFGEVEATWSDDNPICRLLINHGGIVMAKKDVALLPKNVGVVTNLNCELV